MEQREKVLLGLAVVIGVGILVWYVLLPAWNDYQSWDQQIDRNVEQIREAHIAGQDMESLYQREIELGRKLKKLQQRIPQGEQQFLQVVSHLEEQATKAGITGDKIRQFGEAGESEGELVDELYISAQFEQITMSRMVNMLWRFENFQRLIDIRQIAITPREDENQDAHFFDLEMQLVVYKMSADAKLEEI